MINVQEILLTELEATNAAHARGSKTRLGTNPLAMARRKAVAEAQVSKVLWNIVDQLRTNGSLEAISSDDLTAAAILEQITIVADVPHPTGTIWFEIKEARRTYVQTADPLIRPGPESGDLGE